jgi:hypothetical protein
MYTMLVQFLAVNGTSATYLQQTGKFKDFQCSHCGNSQYKAIPIRLFKIVWGLPASAEGPQIQGLDNLPRYGS